MAKVNIKIEGIPYEVEAGMTILEAAKACGYEIPSLCAFNHGECSRGSCRVCLVEATGARGLCRFVRLPRQRRNGNNHFLAQGGGSEKMFR